VVAAPALRRATWIAAAVLAAAAIAALAVQGRRPDPALVTFTAAGVLADLPPERVTAVIVSADERRREFTRDAGGGWRRSGAPAAADATASIERGLRFLHASAAERVMGREELSGTRLAELGLDPPRYAVTVRDAAGPRLTVEFGTLNPLGLAQYARVAGHDEVLLLPSFVGEPWTRLITER